MRAKKLDVGEAIAWYQCGWNLFARFAAVWTLLGVALLLIALVCFAVPFLGPIVFVFVLPVLGAGFLIGADDASRGDYVDWRTLWGAFSSQELLVRLLILGGLLLGLVLVASIIGLALAGGSMPGIGLPGAPASHVADPGHMLGFAVVLLVQVAAVMCMFFAIPLTTFDGMGPVEAILTSFGAATKNIQPLLLFIIIYIILLFIAYAPFLLGLILLFPITFCSMYCAYQRVFK